MSTNAQSVQSHRASQVSTSWTPRDRLHALTIALSVITFLLVQLEVPDPYLDEIFHIPQTQRYCDEEFEYWDPAITTPPGLYLLTAIPLMTVHVPCTVPLIRVTNLFFSALIIPGLLSSLLETSISPHSKSAPRQLRLPLWRHFLRPSIDALVISTFPLISFFTNLYYTDVASLAGVLGTLTLAKRDRHWLAVLVGIWSMTVRQTNVIWVAFALATSLLDFVKVKGEKRNKEKVARIEVDCTLEQLRGPGQMVSIVRSTISILLEQWHQVLWILLPYSIPFGGFLGFLKWNGGIVLGHKDQHVAVAHLPQMLYFIAFASIMLLPTLLAQGIPRTIKGALQTGLGGPSKVLVSLMTVSAMILAVHKFTMFHPFLLADNRHYVFYLLRRVFLPFPMVKYLVVPLYLAASWVWLWRLRQSATVLWSIAFLGCTAVVLIPSPLIEPRYFLIPTILLRIRLGDSPLLSSSPSHNRRRPWLEYAYYAVINAGTIGLFLVRKFRWEGWEGWMRFMW